MSAMTPTPGGPVSAKELDARNWAMFCHLSSLAGFVIPFGNLLGPLICWQMKKQESAFIDEHGKESLNFQLTMFIAAIVSAVLSLILIGVLFLCVIAIAGVILPIIAGLAAGRGETYRYPLTIRFLT